MAKQLDELSPETAPHKHYTCFRYTPTRIAAQLRDITVIIHTGIAPHKHCKRFPYTLDYYVYFGSKSFHYARIHAHPIKLTQGHTNTHPLTHTDTQTHTDTHMHTYIYTHIQVRRPPHRGGASTRKRTCTHTH